MVWVLISHFNLLYTSVAQKTASALGLKFLSLFKYPIAFFCHQNYLSRILTSCYRTLIIDSFINKHLLNLYTVPGLVLSTADRSGNKREETNYQYQGWERWHHYRFNSYWKENKEIVKDNEEVSCFLAVLPCPQPSESSCLSLRKGLCVSGSGPQPPSVMRFCGI